MFKLSKSGIIHYLLNRKYNYVLRLLLASISWLYCLLISCEVGLSSFFAKEIFFGNDLKTSVRRLIWLSKYSFLKLPYSVDFMFDFCTGLGIKEIKILKKKLLNTHIKNLKFFYDLDLLKLLAYEIELSSDFEKSELKLLKKDFNNCYQKLRANLDTSKNIFKQPNYERNSKKYKNLNLGMNISKAKNALEDLDYFFSSCNIPWFVIAGTFLGFIREKSFLKHDLDIDIGIDTNSSSYEYLAECIKKNNKFNISRIEYQKEYFSCENFIIRPIFVRILHINGINIDCFLHFNFKEKIYHGTSNLLWENSFFELANYEIYNLKIKGPKNWDLYLRETYGDWNKEKKDYIYHKDMLSLSGAKNFFGIEYLLRVGFFYGKNIESNLDFLAEILLSNL